VMPALNATSSWLRFGSLKRNSRRTAPSAGSARSDDAGTQETLPGVRAQVHGLKTRYPDIHTRDRTMYAVR
jgi:hypothetical protein